MGKRSKAAKTSARTVTRQEGKLDWETFNFLENMLVFCLEKSLSVPAESGVKFSISRQAEPNSLCLLFKIDRKSDPLVLEEGHPRPDYLAFYKSADQCIFTIIEMKGKTENQLERGIEQMTTFRDRLKREFSEHFPLFGSAYIQGILLHAINSQVPLPKIKAEAIRGFVILPIQSDRDTELWPYITKENRLTDHYRHEKLTPSDDVNWVEKTLVHSALPKRIEDEWCKTNFDAKAKVGVCISYSLSNKGEYATLLRTNGMKQIVIAVQEEENYHKQAIETFLVSVRLDRKFRLHKL